MAVYSMTGYANLSHKTAQMNAAPAAVLSLEIRSVNSRFLDLAFKLSEELRGTEPSLRELLGSELRRGKVEVRAWVEGREDHSLKPPTTTDLQKLLSMQDGVKAWLPTAAPLSVGEVLALTSRQEASPPVLTEDFLKLAKLAVADLKTARAREGDRLSLMLSGHAAQLTALAARAKPMIPLLIEHHRLKFLDRWREAYGAATQVTSDVAHERALSEATAYAFRIDVAEELTRLLSHLEEIIRLLKSGGEMGKRLDFLIQELHREANTLGSKSSSLELTKISVDMKVLIEQMREQVQNLE